MKNKLKIIVVGILLLISFILLYNNHNLNLEVFKNTNLDDNNKIEKILGLLDYGKSLENFELTDDFLNINYNIEMYNYKTLEKNASILFYLINDLKVVNYKIDEEEYSFSYDKVSLIYNNFDKIKITDINKRYTDKNFENTYLGNIGGKIDLFDISDICLTEYIEAYRDNEYIYYITCSSLDDIIVVIDKDEYKLQDALEQEKLEINDLFDTNVDIKKESLKDNEDID